MGGCGEPAPVSGVPTGLLCVDAKLAGWKRGRDGSLRGAVLARHWPLPGLAFMLRGDGGRRGSKRSNCGDSGDRDGIAVEGRAGGI